MHAEHGRKPQNDCLQQLFRRLSDGRWRIEKQRHYRRSRNAAGKSTLRAEKGDIVSGTFENGWLEVHSVGGKNSHLDIPEVSLCLSAQEKSQAPGQ